MNGPDFTPLLHATWPEIALALAALLIVALDASILRRHSLRLRRNVATLLGSAGCVAAAALMLSRSGSVQLADGLLFAGPLSRAVSIALLVLALFALLLADADHPSQARYLGPFTIHTAEYAATILFATVAVLFLVSTQNLLMIFLTLEFLSICLYILTGFDKQSRRSAEAALTYFFYGSASAAFLLFGISFLYGLAGSLDLRAVASYSGANPTDPLFLIAVLMLLVGLGFKTAAAPFHLWAPDAYQGAPSVSAGFIASISKVASFFVLAQVLGVALAASSPKLARQPAWMPALLAIAALSMVLGNLAAIAQTSLRRMLAYSAIGHTGYMLLAIAAGSQPSFSALLYYVITYALAALGAFGVLGALEHEGIDRLESLAGLSRRAPGLAFCLLIFILSLAGIPPLPVFLAKFWLFSAALQAQPRFHLLWLVALAIAMSAISLYYYLRVLKQAYVASPRDNRSAVPVEPLTRITLGVLALLVMALGCAPHLLMRWLAV